MVSSKKGAKRGRPFFAVSDNDTKNGNVSIHILRMTRSS